MQGKSQQVAGQQAFGDMQIGHLSPLPQVVLDSLAWSTPPEGGQEVAQDPPGILRMRRPPLLLLGAVGDDKGVNTHSVLLARA